MAHGELDQAMQIFQKSLEIEEKTGNVKGKSATLHQMATIYAERNDIANAMRLYEQSLELAEKTGNLENKSATLHQIGNLFASRKDIETAVQYYQQSRAILDVLGDVQGKAMNLGMVGQVLWESGSYRDAICSHYEGLSILLEKNLEPQTQQAMKDTFCHWRIEMGPQKFDPLWIEVTGNTSLPSWLA